MLTPSPKLLEDLDPAALFSLGQEIDETPDASWDPPALKEVAALFPKWQAKGLLGRGGMGAVYHFYQPELDRNVAMKLLPIEACAEERAVERFRREARALARLRHPNIVTLHEAGITPAGHFFFVMEYVDGLPLNQLIAEGKMDVASAIEVVRQVCDALACAHAQGVIHRDIKPSNILLDSKGQVKVADFGLARLDRAAEESVMTVSYTGAFLGTPAYTAPEQVRDAAHVDHRADIFSLGVLLYEMLTGELPRGVFQPPSRKTGSDARLDSVVQRALQERPEDRYQAASELKQDVTEAATSRSRKSGMPSLSRRACAVIFLLALLLAGGAAAWHWHANRTIKQEVIMVEEFLPPPTVSPAMRPASKADSMSEPAIAPSEPTLTQPASPLDPIPAVEDVPLSGAKVHVWSLDPVPPALYPPTSVTSSAWKDAVLTAHGGVVLLNDGAIVTWSDLAPGKEHRPLLPEAILKLTATSTSVIAWGQGGAAFLLPNGPNASLRAPTEAELKNFLIEMNGKRVAEIEGEKPAGLSPLSRVIVQDGFMLAWDSDGKATLWGLKVTDSPQRFRLPEGVTEVRLGPTGLMVAW